LSGIRLLFRRLEERVTVLAHRAFPTKCYIVKKVSGVRILGVGCLFLLIGCRDT
jgi:hypothetical protein